MVGPGARKPSVGEGIESRRPLFCSGITTLHSLFIYLFFLSFIFTFASILVCVNNNNSRVITRNNASQRTTTLPFITRDRKTLRERGLRHCIVRATRFQTVLITQFRIFARKCNFSQSGSHITRQHTCQLSRYLLEYPAKETVIHLSRFFVQKYHISKRQPVEGRVRDLCPLPRD